MAKETVLVNACKLKAKSPAEYFLFNAAQTLEVYHPRQKPESSFRIYPVLSILFMLTTSAGFIAFKVILSTDSAATF